MTLLKNKNILVTAGPTRGYLDAVRYITNTSTGKLGVEIALEAMRHGGTVTYVYGKGSLVPVLDNRHKASQLKLIEIETNDDLMRVVRDKLRNKEYDAIVHAMAVADYVPFRPKPNKTSSKKKEWMVKLVKTPKVISTIRDMWPDALLVGFKLEVNKTKDELLKIAKRFLKESKADLVVANDDKNVSNNRHIAYLVSKDCKTPTPSRSKKEIAKNIVIHLGKNV